MTSTKSVCAGGARIFTCDASVGASFLGFNALFDGDLGPSATAGFPFPMTSHPVARAPRSTAAEADGSPLYKS